MSPTRLLRTLAVFATAFRIVAGYLAVEFRSRSSRPEERAARMAEQHRASAERLAALAGRLRGLLTKSGQYLSARPDLLPEPYIEPLARLQDSVSPKPYRTIAAQIERDLGRPVSQLFAKFDAVPLAAASLAQVHRAILHDGRDVAVKVLYPDVERIVATDLRNLRLIVGVVARLWPRYDFRTLYREIERLVPAELDFRHEAANAERIAADLSNRDDAVIPQILHQYSSRRVLTMNFIDGIRIGDVDALRRAGLDPALLALQAIDIFGAQVIEHGFYHGDPHPGNIIALLDGRLGLIDFGQALSLSPEQRRTFAELALAGRRQDPVAAVAAVRALGIRLPERSNSAVLQMAASTMGPAGASAGSTGTEQDAADVSILLAKSLRDVSLEGVSGETLCVFRVQGLLRGLRTRLGTPGPVIAEWANYAEALLESQASDGGAGAT